MPVEGKDYIVKYGDVVNILLTFDLFRMEKIHALAWIFFHMGDSLRHQNNIYSWIGL